MSAEKSTKTWCEIVVQELKMEDAKLVTYVPDNVPSPLIRLLHADPYFTVICPACEEETVGIGNNNFDFRASGQRPQNFYLPGSMGLAAPIALGVAA